MARVVGDSLGYTFALLDGEGQPTEYRFSLPSVSALKRELSAPALETWKIDETILGIKRAGVELKGKTPKEIREAIAEAGHGHEATSRSAADKGSAYHDLFEKIVWGVEVEESDAIVKAFADWWRRQRAEGWHTYETELPVWSLKHGLACQLDFLLMRGDEYRLIDHKPKINWQTKRPYFEQVFQLAAQAICVEERLGIYVKDAAIVTYKTFGVYPVDRQELDEAQQAVKAVRKVMQVKTDGGY